jgi:hypothetical protein
MTHPEMVKAAKVIASQVASGRPDREPDFAFEHSNGDVALMEAKGSFVHPINDDPSTKDDLRQALHQLNAWMGMIAPAPKKSYAIGTYFRERSDSTGDESLIAFVDPPGESTATAEPVELPQDWIRRGNYGAWLTGMGFPEAGDALRSNLEYAPSVVSLPVIAIGDRDFAITFHGAVIKRNAKRRYPLIAPWIGPWLDDPFLEWQILRHSGISGIIVLGIATDTLKSIEMVLRPRTRETLLSLKVSAPTGRAAMPEAISDGFTGSIMPDNTLMGQIDPELLRDVETQVFYL